MVSSSSSSVWCAAPLPSYRQLRGLSTKKEEEAENKDSGSEGKKDTEWDFKGHTTGAELFRASTQFKGRRDLRSHQEMVGHYNPLTQPTTGGGVMPPQPDVTDPAYKKRQKKQRRRLLWLLVLLAFGGEALRVHSHNHSVDPEYNWATAFFQAIPARILSRAWGAVHDVELPTFMRSPLYHAWTYVFDCKLEEMRDPLESYPNLAKFFTRHLKPGVRPIADNDIVSPADSRISVFGELKDGDRLEQIKGMTYSLQRLIGRQADFSDPNNKVYYAVFYLAPGDYHRLHAPADFSVAERRHIPGEMFSVSPFILKYIPNLFVLNERVVLNGRWKHGFFSFTAVAAYNVGNIKLSFDEGLISNRGELTVVPEPKRFNQPPFLRKYTRDGDGGLSINKADEIARFELGSTVVLVWEVKNGDFEFTCTPHGRIKMGESFGRIIPHAPIPTSHPVPTAVPLQ